MTYPKPADYPLWLRVVVVITLALFVVNVFFFIAPVTAFVTWATANPIGGKEILAGLGTLVASFAGAWFAFRFARRQRDRDRIEGEISAGNLALFTLMEMWNDLRQHQLEIIEPYRNNPAAWLNLPVSQRLDAELSFDTNALSFVLQTDPQLFAEVLQEQHRFRLAAHLIEDHRTVMMSEARPRLERAGIKIGERRIISEFETAIGVDATHKLQMISAAIIKNFDENVISTRRVFLKLRALLKTLYPRRRFLNFQPNP
jgi:hypothetical protein